MPIEEYFPTKSIQPIAKIEAQRRQFYRPIYSVHKSWARRPGSTFRAIGLAHFLDEPLFDKNHLEESQFYQTHSFEGKIALDPFCGGGTSLVELNRLGVKTIGIDLNPVAWLTTKKELDAFDVDKFNQEIQQLTKDVGNKIKQLYQTNCPECHSHKADIMYTFWVRTINCPKCDSKEDLFKYYIIGKKQRNSPETMVICPDCNHLFYSKGNVKE
ncbi:MAG: DNA methyltransferase, partial [Candidatus Hodarchaeales archaeon]